MTFKTKVRKTAPEHSLRIVQHELKEHRKKLLGLRSSLGTFKGKHRSLEDRIERTRLENLLKEVEIRIKSNARRLKGERE